MSDVEMSDDESVMFGDPNLGEAVEDHGVPNLRDDLLQSYGDGVLADDQLTTDPELESIFTEDNEQPIDYSRSPHPLSDSESDDNAPATKNPLRNLIKDAEKVCCTK
jgi:hypothetical protein